MEIESAKSSLFGAFYAFYKYGDYFGFDFLC